MVTEPESQGLEQGLLVQLKVHRLFFPGKERLMLREAGEEETWGARTRSEAKGKDGAGHGTSGAEHPHACKCGLMSNR